MTNQGTLQSNSGTILNISGSTFQNSELVKVLDGGQLLISSASYTNNDTIEINGPTGTATIEGTVVSGTKVALSATELGGLYNFRNRDLSPTLGRWMSQDPTQYEDGQNVYLYEHSNTINHQDPTGTTDVSMSIKTEIRPPHAQPGVKSIQSARVNESGIIVPGSVREYTGNTAVYIPGTIFSNPIMIARVEGVRSHFLIEVSGSNPYIHVHFRGQTASFAAFLLPIKYDIDFDLDFCSETGSVSGTRTMYPSYSIHAEGKTVADFPQPTIPDKNIPNLLALAFDIDFGPIEFPITNP
jgi:RHS repeat-associated protein